MKHVLQVNFHFFYHWAFQEQTQQNRTICCPLSCSSIKASGLPVKAKDTLFFSDTMCLPKYFLWIVKFLITVLDALINNRDI